MNHNLKEEDYYKYNEKEIQLYTNPQNYNIDIQESLKHINLWLNIQEDSVINHDKMIYNNSDYYEFEKDKYLIKKTFANKLLKLNKQRKFTLRYDDQIKLYKQIGLFKEKIITGIICEGLGNRLFQIASLYGISKTFNYRINFVVLPNKHSKNNYNFILNKLEIINDVQNKIRINENKMYEVDDKLLENINNIENPLIFGYYQCPKYFDKYRNIILEIFKEPEYVTEYLKKYKNLEESYFLHVRLGDALEPGIRNEKHFIDLNNYFNTCINQIEGHIYLFSDSPELVYKYFPILLNHNVTFVKEKDELISLYMMSKCLKGGICSNSTFSWWGAYLNTNPNKKIFMPSKFINNYQGITDIYFKGVEVVNV
jgi:hypothetical protein